MNWGWPSTGISRSRRCAMVRTSGLRGVLGCCGLDAAWLLPALILGVLVSWQAWGRYAWRVDTDTLVGMLAEACCWPSLWSYSDNCKTWRFVG